MRMIDADSLIDLVENSSILSAGFKQAFCKLVAGEPTVEAAPVVRCKDCKQYRIFIGRDMCAKNAKMLNWVEVGLCATGSNDFCSYGEKRSEPPVQHRPELEGGIT